MSWPLSHEFNEAIQNPQLVFSDPDLKATEAVVGPQGLPLPRSGNFADVYHMRGAGGREWAVKCFTRPVVGLGERYARISECLAHANLPFAIEFTYLAEGIRVAGAWRPIVKMEWVEGFLLNQLVRENVARAAILSTLGQMWVKLCKRLRETGIAHADLQHGNVLLVPGSRPGAYGLKLIDYDGVYVPALANTPSGESGHPSFQHPARAASRTYSPDVDRFPHLVVATALRGLSVGGTTLWERYDNGDNLLFTEADYRKPAASKLMRELWQTENPAVQALVGRLAIACGQSIPQTPWLDQIAPDGEPTLLDAASRREAAAALGIAVPVTATLPLGQATRPQPDESKAPSEENPPPAVVTSPDRKKAKAELDVDDDVEPVAESTGKKKKPKRKKAAPTSFTKGILFFAAGAGAGLLLIGGVIGGLLIARGKHQPSETVQQKQDDQKMDEKKDSRPRPPVNPPPKDSDRPPALPTQPIISTPQPLVQPQKLGDRLELKKQWAVELGPEFRLTKLHCSSDSRVVIAASGSGDVAKILDTATGKPVMDDIKTRRRAKFQPLDGGRMALLGPGAAIPVLDTKTKEWVDVPSIQIPTKFSTYTAVSPDGRYVAVGTSNSLSPAPFKVKRVSDGKIILECDWVRGHIHFTSDSSRVLLAQENGQYRWFKLPSGEPDGEWQLKKPPIVGPTGFGLYAISPDGSLGFYDGRLVDHAGDYHLIDGRTGNVIRSFTGYTPQFSSVSADGQLAVLPIRDGIKLSSADIVATKTGKIVAKLTAPPESEFLIATILPDRSGVLTLTTGNPALLTRYDLVSPGLEPALTPAHLTIKERHRVKLDFTPEQLSFDADGMTAVAHNYRSVAVGIDVRTGTTCALTARSNLHPCSAVALAGGIGLWASGGKDITVLDSKTGKPTGTLPMPKFPVTRMPVPEMIKVSPDKRYIAVGLLRLSPSDPKGKPEPSPFRLFDTKTQKNVLEMDWNGGSIFFNSDSSRMLVVDSYLHAQWFNLPFGEVHKEWTLKHQMAGNIPRFRIVAASQDASVLLGQGVLEKKTGLFILNGETGEITSAFTSSAANPRLSADGKLLFILEPKPATQDKTLIVLDVAKKKEVARLNIPNPNPTQSYYSMAVAPDGRTVVLTDRFQPGTVVIYELTDDGH